MHGTSSRDRTPPAVSNRPRQIAIQNTFASLLFIIHQIEMSFLCHVFTVIWKVKVVQTCGSSQVLNSLFIETWRAQEHRRANCLLAEPPLFLRYDTTSSRGLAEDRLEFGEIKRESWLQSDITHDQSRGSTVSKPSSLLACLHISRRRTNERTNERTHLFCASPVRGPLSD